MIEELGWHYSKFEREFALLVNCIELYTENFLIYNYMLHVHLYNIHCLHAHIFIYLENMVYFMRRITS